MKLDTEIGQILTNLDSHSIYFYFSKQSCYLL